MTETKADFENFNASYVYDKLDTLDPIDKIQQVRYCFDFPKNETFPEYGEPDNGGNGTFFNVIVMKLKPNITNTTE